MTKIKSALIFCDVIKGTPFDRGEKNLVHSHEPRFLLLCSCPCKTVSELMNAFIAGAARIAENLEIIYFDGWWLKRVTSESAIIRIEDTWHSCD